MRHKDLSFLKAKIFPSSRDCFRRLFQTTQKELGTLSLSEAILHVVENSEP